MVSGGKRSTIETRSLPNVTSVAAASTGRITATDASRVERCDPSSKCRNSAISSPQNSRRTGSAMPNE